MSRKKTGQSSTYIPFQTSLAYEIARPANLSSEEIEMAKDISLFTVPLDTPICCLDASKSFLCLTNEEKLYCHYLSRACWEGGYICLLQTSPESVPIFVLLRELFSKQTVSSLREAAKGVVNDDEFKVSYFLYYFTVWLICVLLEHFHPCRVFCSMLVQSSVTWGITRALVTQKLSQALIRFD